MINFSKQLVKNLGLTEAQAAVYLAALELGQASMQDLARKSGVKRTSIYNFIHELKERRLMTETKKRKRSMYSAVHPEVLLETQKTHLHEIEHILPELLAIHNHSQTKPKVTFYEGADGIQEVYADTLKERKPIIAWTDYDHILAAMGKQFTDSYPLERARRNIPFRTIARDTPFARELAKKNIGALREIKFIKEELKTEINIYGNRVAIMSFRNSPPFCVLIEDANIAETLRVAWKQLWDRLE